MITHKHHPSLCCIEIAHEVSVPIRRPGDHVDEFSAWLPERAWAAYVLSDDVGALYVGQTRNPRSRLRQHCATKSWWCIVESITLYAVADEIEARAVEYDLHDELRPLHSRVTSADDGRLSALVRAVQA